MMLIGRIAKQEGSWWYAECEIIGAFTQGRSRKDAATMLADCIETKIGRAGFKATVTENSAAGDNVFTVFVEANEPALLAAEVLKYQREVHGLSLADVAKLLGASSRNAYARYEQGRAVPSMDKLSELLRVVAPQVALVLAERAPAKRAPVKRATKARKKRVA